jgi:hypothetical protein
MIPIPGMVSAAWASGKWIIIACVVGALLAVGFYGGKRWETGNTQKALRERDAAKADAVAWHQRADSFQAGIGRWEERYAADQRSLNEQKKRAGEILERLEKQKASAAAQEKAWRERYAASIKSPDCAELLKETTCAAFQGF